MHEIRVTQVGDDLAVDSKAQAQLEAGRRIMARYKDALRKLAE